jgi:hypothetical protein
MKIKMLQILEHWKLEMGEGGDESLDTVCSQSGWNGTGL